MELAFPKIKILMKSENKRKGLEGTSRDHWIQPSLKGMNKIEK